MNQTHVTIAPIACNLSHLIVFTPKVEMAETILRQDEPVALRVTVEFSRSGAIALLPLGLALTVEFFAKPFGAGTTIALGKTNLITTANQFTYLPTLELSTGFATLGLQPEKVYKISALLQVGASDFPAFINGFTEGLTLQTYVP